MLNSNHNHEMNSNDLDFNYAGFNLVIAASKEDDNVNIEQCKLREGCREEKTYFLWSFANSPPPNPPVWSFYR